MRQTQPGRNGAVPRALPRWAGALIAFTAVLPACICAVFAVTVASQLIGSVPPPALAPGEAPPLPKPGPLADPRSHDQAGFPAALTRSVIPAESPLMPEAVAVGEKLFFESRLSGDAPHAAIRRAPSLMADPRQLVSMAGWVSAMRQPF